MSHRKEIAGAGISTTAESAGLRYWRDDRSGLRRESHGEGFRYLDAEGREIGDPETLGRIAALAIPPAWKEVWICPEPDGHLQATGRDAKGRKQYRYHSRWRALRDENKYNRMVAFGEALPLIRRTVREHLHERGLGRNKVLASVVRLLELSSIRVGNEEYAQNNRSYGLTTLQDRHAKVRGSKVRFEFRGKSGKPHLIEVDHPLLARIVRQCQELPGQDLFQYLDDTGERKDVTSGDVNAYLREITGQDFTAKDFRTWTGTVLAALALQEFESISSPAGAKKNIVRAIEQVSKRLGNTPAVCRKCYVHPVILDSYLEGTLVTTLRKEAEKEMQSSLERLRPEEAAVVTLLQQKLKDSEDGRLGSRPVRRVRSRG